ncbi:hypothetical protein RHSIM_Rhsim09G0118500 [Rhododendron simsii]|uniref:Uncharacterized protein n=1 Tax=Rhododendron simsii TaxID=118357 RepID=A0A834GK65_RHOSS|nr:hypothetical protein RHSIM_Rhsim09G0118500 [Rhododendron simsii]
MEIPFLAASNSISTGEGERRKLSFYHGLSSSNLPIYGVRSNFTCAEVEEGDGKPMKERWWLAKRGGLRSGGDQGKRQENADLAVRRRKQKQGKNQVNGSKTLPSCHQKRPWETLGGEAGPGAEARGLIVVAPACKTNAT